MQHIGVRGYPISDTLPKPLVVIFLVRSVQPIEGNEFELILTVKMETRHPIKGSFGGEFWRYVIIA